jgi:outer membrane biosynthesis protein TonB
MAKSTHVTPRQAEIKISSLLKGIDNSVLVVEKHRDLIAKSAKEMRTLVSGLSNAATSLAATVKTVEAKAKATKVVKPTKVKPEPKAAKPKAEPKAPKVKPEPKAKPEPKVKAAKLEKVEPKPAVVGRPTAKEAACEMIGTGVLPAAEVYKNAVAKYGYWSRQSFYNALDDAKTFRKTEKGFEIVKNNSRAVDDEVDKFAEKLETTGSAAAVSQVQ